MPETGEGWPHVTSPICRGCPQGKSDVCLCFLVLRPEVRWLPYFYVFALRCLGWNEVCQKFGCLVCIVASAGFYRICREIICVSDKWHVRCVAWMHIRLFFPGITRAGICGFSAFASQWGWFCCVCVACENGFGEYVLNRRRCLMIVLAVVEMCTL